jgi:RNA polymerase sigma factor (sigma-70 family)
MPESPDDISSEALLLRFQAGDPAALDHLWARYLPRLRRWAHGRLPPVSRGDANTDDLVQETFVRSLAAVRRIQPRGAKSLFAYFRTILLNQIRDHANRGSRRPRQDELFEEQHEYAGPSPLERILGNEVIGRYQDALTTLPEDDQQIVMAYVELRCTDRELAELFEKPSADAARMARNRAVARLARAMSAPPAPR